jgi:MurNAc alpha-1-phosphate uridylyltransferase
MILAAGRGERLRPLTDHTPKPLIEVHGQSLISYHLQNLALAGFREVVINVSHLREMIQENLGDGSNWGLTIRYSDESDHALDTGGGIQQALPWLGDAPFAVINGDVFTHYPLTRLRAVKCNHAHLIMVPNPSHNPIGDWGLSGGRMDPDVEPRHTFSGISVYHPSFFAKTTAGRFSVVPMLEAAARQKQVTAELYRGEWHDIGTLERLETLRNS